MGAKSARRSWGTGSIVEKSPGVWRVFADGGADPDTGRRRRRSKLVRGTKADARLALRDLLAEKPESPSRPRGDNLTVAELLDLRVADARGRQRSPTTVAGYESKIETRLKPAFGHVKVADLSPRRVEEQYARWAAEGLAPATIRQCHAILMSAYRMGVRWGHADASWVARVSGPGGLSAQHSTPPSAEEVGEWVRRAEEAGDRVLATAAALAAVTGMRRGELVALRWSDLDLDAQTVTVNRSVSRTKEGLWEGSTKTHQGRTVPLGPLGVEAVKLHQAWQRRLAQAAETALVDDPRLLSLRADGAIPISPDTLTHRWHTLCGGQVRLHDLRHFAATVLVAAGVDIRTVSRHLGHAQPTMTLNRYAHPLEDRQRAAALVLDAVLEREP